MSTSAGSSDDAALLWARSGAMWLTGHALGPPSVGPAAVAVCAQQALEALVAISGESWRGGPIDGAALVGEHASAAGLSRRGRVSAGGSARLLEAADNFIVLNLARVDDVALLPALFEAPIGARYWDDVQSLVARRSAAELVERGRLMGLAVAELKRSPPSNRNWFRVAAQGDKHSSAHPSTHQSPLVVDLSALWAGPLVAHLLWLAGARVVKVEDKGRPDGARGGPKRFFDLLNGGKQSLALDFRDQEDCQRLGHLIEQADIVIESSRPRALKQLGINAEDIVKRRSGLTWISITGYGRATPQANWVAFGDDAAAAAGLAHLAGTDKDPCFCADAVADPLTGIHAALAAMTLWRAGGGALVDISLADVASYAGNFLPAPEANVSLDGGKADHWIVSHNGRTQAVLKPRIRRPSVEATKLGMDNAAIISEFNL